MRADISTLDWYLSRIVEHSDVAEQINVRRLMQGRKRRDARHFPTETNNTTTKKSSNERRRKTNMIASTVSANQQLSHLPAYEAKETSRLNI